jgi:hypothetical protein
MDDEGDVVDPLVIPKPILREAAAWVRILARLGRGRITIFAA